MGNLKRVAVLGSTGSIGKKTLAALADMRDRFIVTAITAHENMTVLARQAWDFSPAFVGVTGACDIHSLREAMPQGTAVCGGPRALLEACDYADIVVLSVVGIAGLPAFEYCLKKGIPVALANKEAMVCGGRLARDLMDATGTPVLPVDSELSAIFQCLEGNKKQDVKSIWLTASGGPFRTASLAEMQQATKAQALRHPNWNMGAKITIDCATMINKGLEIMETRWLFDIPADKIHVVVHPESIVHSMVEYVDNAVIAQMSVKDMRLAIVHALTYPDRVASGVERLDLFAVSALHFEQPDLLRFPGLALAYQAVKSDDSLQLVLNSANEVAVDLFLHDRIRFMDIAHIVELGMLRFSGRSVRSFEELYELDREVRGYCQTAALEQVCGG